jgi:hypothetical protein
MQDLARDGSLADIVQIRSVAQHADLELRQTQLNAQQGAKQSQAPGVRFEVRTPFRQPPGKLPGMCGR